MDERMIKPELLEPLLKAADFSEGGLIIGVLAKAPRFFPGLVEIGLEKVDSTEKGVYRILRSILNVTSMHVIDQKRWPEIPKDFFQFLGKALAHPTKSVRKRALQIGVTVAAVLYGEFRISRQVHQRELLNEFGQVPMAFFQGEDFENFIQDDWVSISRWAGWKYQIDYPQNLAILEEIFGSIWPGFKVNP